MGVPATEAGARRDAGRGRVWSGRTGEGLQHRRRKGLQTRRCQDAKR